MNELIDNFYTMIQKYEETHYIGKPEIVMICTPDYYCKTLREMRDNRFYYKGDDIENNFIHFEIIGVRVPLIVKKLKNNIDYQLMFREDYEAMEKEEMYKRFYKMWN